MISGTDLLSIASRKHGPLLSYCAEIFLRGILPRVTNGTARTSRLGSTRALGVRSNYRLALSAFWLQKYGLSCRRTSRRVAPKPLQAVFPWPECSGEFHSKFWSLHGRKNQSVWLIVEASECSYGSSALSQRRYRYHSQDRWFTRRWAS